MIVFCVGQWPLGIKETFSWVLRELTHSQQVCPVLGLVGSVAGVGGSGEGTNRMAGNSSSAAYKLVTQRKGSHQCEAQFCSPVKWGCMVNCLRTVNERTLAYVLGAY